MCPDGNRTMASMVIEAIKNAEEKGMHLQPDIIVITGDFTNRGLSSEFDNAKWEIMAIKQAFSSVKDCVVVPGNHDYLWTEDGQPVPEERRNINYKNFRTLCKSSKICKAYPSNLKYAIKRELEKYLITFSYVDCEYYAVLTIGMNSDMLDSAERAGQGYFEKGQLDACKSLIKHYQNLCASSNKKLIITTAFHHHILPVSSVEQDTLRKPEKFSLTLDARRTLNFFMENNVRLAMHGHQHQPSVVCWKDEMKDSGECVYVSSAGSMTQNRTDLGDVSKNSFMIYEVDENNVKVFCFQNKDSDWDTMELAHDFYLLPLHDQTKADIPCDIVKNANYPNGISFENYSSERDTSDLFYLFLSVVDCNNAREEILNYTSSYKDTQITICGIHHLYGKYDVLLKYRAQDGDLYQRNLRAYLQSRKVMNSSDRYYFMNVSYENQHIKEIKQIPLLTNPEAYLNSTWNMATLTVYLDRIMNTETFMSKLNSAIELFNIEHNTKIEDIIRNYAVGQDQNVIFELFISCYQFPMLTRFTNLVEEIIRDSGIDKSTHIIYYFDERHI